MTSHVFSLMSLADTDEFGRRLAAELVAGDVIALVGPMGAGKTHFTRAVAAGLGVPDPWAVTSPTFVLIQEYVGGRLPVYHFDTYRLDDPVTALAMLGVDEYFQGDGVCLIEWGDRIEALLPAEHLRVEIEPPTAEEAETSRRVTLVARGDRFANRVRRLSANADDAPR